MQAAEPVAESVTAAAPKPRGRWRAVAALGLGLLLLAVFDAAVFRSGLYSIVVEPDSTTGIFELTLRRELLAQQSSGDNLVVTLGDSRFAYLPRQTNEFTPRTGWTFRHAGIPGTDARTWFYMLRDLDPTRRRYKAILIGVNDYDDEDFGYVQSEDVAPMHYFVGHLRLSDLYAYPSTLSVPSLRWQAVRGILFPGLIYQPDIQALLSHPVKRFTDVAMYRKDWGNWTWDYEPETDTMEGLEVDWVKWTFHLPPTAKPVQHETVHDVLMRPVVPQVGTIAGFRRLWLGRIFELYRGSPTRILFVRLPRGPIPRPDNLVVKRSATIRDWARSGMASLLAEDACNPLEHPELFKDAMHLNREGSRRFAAILADEVTRVLGHGPGPKP